LPEALLMQFRMWLDAQAGAVGMRADQAHATVGQRAFTQFDGDDRGVVAGDVKPSAAFATPRLAFIQTLIAGSLKSLCQAAGCVKRGGRGFEKIDQTLIKLGAHIRLQHDNPQSLTHRPLHRVLPLSRNATRR
jgi:hypothetical protein